jgi:hypothetical protein
MSSWLSWQGFDMPSISILFSFTLFPQRPSKLPHITGSLGFSGCPLGLLSAALQAMGNVIMTSTPGANFPSYENQVQK